ncbi:hypothetical protein NESM_000076600 [Novymonas esmeraldas]|uniref:200 kDa antigen p200 n=1 Tax=Novymonas esmeraldas TaxID=1808958 RepID=A0AAW0F216_9TRYP
MASSVEAWTADGPAALSSRLLFQDRISALLSAPMPRCLRVNSPPRLSAASAGAPAALEATRGGVGVLRLGHGGGGERTPQRRTASATAGSVPIHEALLQKGRLMQERRELLRQEAIARELREVRPAPRVAVASAPLPVEAPRPATRLPPEGQRIEDKLLQRAREKHALLEKAAAVRAEREAEDLAAVATFHPSISAHAQATKSRYQEPPPDRAAWRASRLAELAEVRHSAEEEALQDVPVINPHSAVLAARKKARDGLEGVPVADVLLVGEHRRRLAQWQAAEAEREAQAQTGPSITRHAAAMQRMGTVGDRLHADSYGLAIRRLQREVTWREAHTPFQPLVTPLAAASAPRYLRDSDADVRGSSLLDQHSAARHGPAPRDTFQPSINPVSAAIAQRLPETAMERLCRPSAVHSLSSYVDPAGDADNFGLSPASSPRPAAMHQHTPRQLWRTPSAQRHRDGPSSATPSTTGALPSAVVASLDAYERRRQRRLAALREEQTQLEQRECTFQPHINARSSAAPTDDVAGARGLRGPNVVAQRSEEWQRQRERHLETMRQWQAERTAAAAAASAAPAAVTEATVRGNASHTALSTSSSVPPESHSVYGGDGTPWGVDEYLKRQQLARTRRQEAQSALGYRGAAAEEHRRAAPAAAMPRAASMAGSGQHGRDADSMRRSSSPIRSLRPPVSMLQQQSIAQILAGADEDGRHGGR